jgi:hypothetical protein
LSKIVSLFVAHLSVFILIWRGFEENGSSQKKQMVGSLVLDPQSIAKRLNSTHYQVVYHQVTGHPGSKRLYQHIHKQYYNCDLCRLVDNFKSDYCQ